MHPFQQYTCPAASSLVSSSLLHYPLQSLNSLTPWYLTELLHDNTPVRSGPPPPDSSNQLVWSRWTQEHSVSQHPTSGLPLDIKKLPHVSHFHIPNKNSALSAGIVTVNFLSHFKFCSVDVYVGFNCILDCILLVTLNDNATRPASKQKQTQPDPNSLVVNFASLGCAMEQLHQEVVATATGIQMTAVFFPLMIFLNFIF